MIGTFAPMKRFLGMTICMVIAFSAMSQSAGNPFDLRFRKPRPSETPVPPPARDTLPVIVPPASVPAPTPTNTDTSSALNQSMQAVNQDSFRGDPANPFEKKGAEIEKEPVDPKPADPVISRETSKDLLPAIIRQKSYKGFQIFFILLSLLFLIFIVNVERSFVRDLWRVISNENYSSLHHRNQRNTMRQILLLMGYAVFVMQSGLFLFFTLRYFRYAGDIFTSIWVTTAFVLVVYLVRHAVIRYLRWLFNNDKEMTLFGFDISIFNTMVGLILLPINILLIFGPDSAYKPLIIIGIVAIGVAYLMRQLRWLLTARQLIAHSLFLFFVYLCAVEILPLWAISKLFW